MIGGLLAGALAGAAGTTALNATTYANMTLRGRPVNHTQKATARKLAAQTGVQLPGDAKTRSHRFEGLGSCRVSPPGPGRLRVRAGGRPAPANTARQWGSSSAQRRGSEAEANKALVELTRMGTDAADFKSAFAKFKKNVAGHAEKEEHEAFPALQKARSVDQRIQLGKDFLEAFTKAGWQRPGPDTRAATARGYVPKTAALPTTDVVLTGSG